MRWWMLVAMVVGAVVSDVSNNCNANENDVISRVMASRSGMAVHWFTQLDATTLSDIVDLKLVIDEDSATTYFEIAGGPLREVISEHDISPFGKPFGRDGAKDHADIRQEVMQAMLNSRRIEATVAVNEYTIPKTTVYSVNRIGVVQAINGETGQTLWRTPVGSTNLPTSGLAASKTHVAVANGSTIFCLEADSGKVLWDRKVKHAIGDSPAISEKAIFVPLLDGRLDVLPISSRGLGATSVTSVGRALSSPTAFSNQVGWATDNGLFTVAEVTVEADYDERFEYKVMTRFRLRGDSPFESSPTSRGGALFLASINGFVYAIDEMRARKMWDISLGQPVSTPPIALDQFLLVFTGTRKIFRIDASVGIIEADWGQSLHNIVGYVGASQTNVYLQNAVGDIVISDKETGDYLGSLGYRGGLFALPNTQTDRLYVCTSTGMLHCLREISNVTPYFHADEPITPPLPGTVRPKKPAKDDSANPFQRGGGGDSGNPFQRGGGSGGNTSGDDGDPFRRGGGGGGGGNSSGDGDPFRRGGGDSGGD